MLNKVFGYLLLLIPTFWLSIRSKPSEIQPNDRTFPQNIRSISPELVSISNRLCCLWSSTRDNTLRKSTFPLMPNHRYGLQPNIANSNLHLLLCILLAGDIATNPGPAQSRRTPDNNCLEVLHLNARSVKSFVSTDNMIPARKVCKITLLQDLVHGSNYEVICIRETWLNNTITDPEPLPGFNIFRQDRTGKIGGGVLIAVKEGLQVTRRSDLERDGVELLVVQLNKANIKPVILYVHYPPSSSSDGPSTPNNSLLSNPESSCIVLVGDPNIPPISWSDNDSTPISSGGCANSEVLCDLIGDNFLQQFAEGPTHAAGNKLDLLFCNRAEVIPNVPTSPSDEHNLPTDHYIIEPNTSTKFTRAKLVRRVTHDHNHADFPAPRRAQPETSLDITLTGSIDDCWMQWKDKFLSIVTSFVPIKTIQDTNSPPWIDGEVRHLISKKHTALRKYRKNKTADSKTKPRTPCQQIKYAIRAKHNPHLAKIEASLNENPKMLRKHHKAILHHHTSPNPTITFNNRTAKSPKEKAELFNTYFCSVFRPAKTTMNPDDSTSSPIPSSQPSDITVSEEEVAKHPYHPDPSKATGPDGIPGRIPKECSAAIAPSLCSLFNHSLRTGTVPSEWKSANVTPVHKKEKKEPATNYRPISLLSIISKVPGRCVCIRPYDHVRVMINDAQHGFPHGRSCVTQLLTTLHRIGQLLDNNTQTDAIFLDFAKAFDSVDHNILLTKPRTYGISGNLYDWFCSYLCGRTQRAVAEGVAPEWSPVTSGVPQGSILGPTPPLLLTNDLPDAIPQATSTGPYADDAKLHRAITPNEDSAFLQTALSCAGVRSADSNITFNTSKRKPMTINNYTTNITLAELVLFDAELI